MKLKAPEGVGDPCVAGVVIAARDGFYEVGPEIGAVLVECFGFVEIDTLEADNAPAPRRPRQPRKSRPRKLKAEE
jgi:hypothetical protein